MWVDDLQSFCLPLLFVFSSLIPQPSNMRTNDTVRHTILALNRVQGIESAGGTHFQFRQLKWIILQSISSVFDLLSSSVAGQQASFHRGAAEPGQMYMMINPSTAFCYQFECKIN